VDYLNYQNAYLASTSDESYPSYDYAYENKVADTLFQRAINIRIGGEYVIFNSFYLRAGYGYYGNALKSESELSPDQLFSGGFGYKRGNYTFDIAYKRQLSHYNYYSFSRGVTELNAVRSIVTVSATYKFK
jgi:long-subunit fatty acid transport protein